MFILNRIRLGGDSLDRKIAFRYSVRCVTLLKVGNASSFDIICRRLDGGYPMWMHRHRSLSDPYRQRRFFTLIWKMVAGLMVYFVSNAPQSKCFIGGHILVPYVGERALSSVVERAVRRLNVGSFEAKRKRTAE